MSIEVKPVQPENAQCPILVTLSGMMLFIVPTIRVLPEFLMRLFPSLRKCVFPAETDIVSRLLQEVKGLVSILVTLFGMVIEVKLVQP